VARAARRPEGWIWRVVPLPTLRLIEAKILDPRRSPFGPMLPVGHACSDGGFRRVTGRRAEKKKTTRMTQSGCRGCGLQSVQTAGMLFTGVHGDDLHSGRY
jgi:hypothetical protein